MYETFDHTADLGLRIRAADLNTLFGEAGLALTSALVEDPATIAQLRLEGAAVPLRYRTSSLFALRGVDQ
jgi:hypothetical protein